MKHHSILVLVLLFFSCCANKDLFYIQHTKVNKNELPAACDDHLIVDINTSWLKHGQQKCHFYNVFSQNLFTKNQDCFKGMKVSLLIKLLGQPDKKNKGQLIYVLDNKCDKKMDENPDYLYRKDIAFILSKDGNMIEDISVINKPKPNDTKTR